jgi:hypothetical protein
MSYLFVRVVLNVAVRSSLFIIFILILLILLLLVLELIGVHFIA